MPSLQLSALLEQQDSEYERLKLDMQKSIIQAALRELGDTAELIDVPTLDELSKATLDNPLNWDPVQSFKKK
jgi:hypothetical protein